MIPKQVKDAIRAEEGLTNTQLAKKYNVSRGTVTNILKAEEIEPDEHPRPCFEVKVLKKRDPVAILEAAAARVESHRTDVDYHKIAIDTKRPIAIMKAADLHFGGLDVDYSSLLAHVKFLKQNKNFYLQLFGDDINMMVMHRMVGARHDGWTPEEQVNWLENLVDMLLEEGKLISMASGNHSDEFTERTAGFGIVRAVMKHKVPYFRGLGYIDLMVGKQTYPMGFVHKTRFKSIMNPLHGNKRMQQMHTELFGINRMPCREYITAHTHNPAFTTEGCQPEQRVHLIKCGTFKTNCLYSQRYFGQGRIGVPTVVYHPDRLEHIVFPTPWEAYRYMNGKDFKI
jgi:hypothetical protein